MNNFKLAMADLIIDVNTIYPMTYNYCREFVVNDGTADFSVTTTEKKIDKEISVAEQLCSRNYAESICIYREIAEILPFYDRCVFHGACIEYDGMGFIFTATSGTGKSTHINLWSKYLGDKVQVVNGDKPILHITPEGTTIYSTPYAGKEGWQNHSSAPMKALVILKRGTVNKITKVNAGKHLTDIFKQMYKPYNTEAAIKSLELLDNLLKLPLYVLECDMSEDAVKCSFEELTGLSFEERKITNEN